MTHVQRPLIILALLVSCAASVHAQVDERVMYVSVVDKRGAPVPNLTTKDFVVREDGQAREILRVVKDTDPLRIALLVDNSVYMQPHVADLRRATQAFLEHTREGAQVALITIGERPTVAVPYTTDRAALKKGADTLFPITGAGNYLLDGVAEAAQGLEKQGSGRPVIAVITGTT